MEKLQFEKLLPRENLMAIEAGYGIDIVNIQQLFTGADRNTFAYKVYTGEKESLFLKTRTGSFDEASVEVPYLLSRSIGAHIIEPLRAADGSLYLKTGDYSVVLYPFISGRPAKQKALTKEQWVQFGEVLKKIHEFELPQNIKKIPRETYDGRWRAGLKKYMGELNNKERDNWYVKQFIGLYDQKSELIKFIINHAEGLLGRVKNAAQDFCLCHGDIHAGNILIADNKEFYIVDWDTLIIAPKERDLMFIGGGVANTWNTKDEEDHFYAGYGRQEKVNQEMINYYRFERIIVDLVEYFEQFFADNIEEKNQKAIIERVGSVFYPDGVVDMAFREGAR